MNAIFFQSAFLADMIYLKNESVMQSIIITLIVFVGVIVIILINNKNSGSVIQYNKAANNYRTASAKITSVEEDDIYIDPYKPKAENLEVLTPRPIWVRRDSLSYYADSEGIRERNKLVRMRNSRINMGISSDQPHETVQKKRYKVKYEFETTGGETYTGEGAFFNNNGIEVGKYIDIKYKPEKPQANFPVGISGV